MHDMMEFDLSNFIERHNRPRIATAGNSHEAAFSEDEFEIRRRAFFGIKKTSSADNPTDDAPRHEP